MIRKPKSLLVTWMAAALVAVGSWFLLPGSPLDHWMIGKVGELTESPPFEIRGEGSHSDPWKLQPSIQGPGPDPNSATVNLEDDPDGIFQTFPHSPIDIAVVLANLKALGTQKLACSVLLAWEEPDAMGLTALEVALADFKSVALAAPVTRGPIMEPLPRSFREASLKLDQVKGNVDTLPQVNRVSLPALIHGGKNTRTGFQSIDSEPDLTAIQVLARWDDRIILAFPVVAAMQQLGLEAEDLNVVVGSHLQFGDAGPSMPIDEFGRLAIPVTESKNPEAIAAVTLLDTEPGDPEAPQLDTVILRDTRSNADLTTQAYNQLLPELIHQLKQGGQELAPKVFPRLHVGFEMLILLGLALALGFSSLSGRMLHSAICLLVTGLFGIAIWFSVNQGLWLPVPSIVLTLLVAWFTGLLLGRRRRQTTSMPRLDRLKFESTQ